MKTAALTLLAGSAAAFSTLGPVRPAGIQRLASPFMSELASPLDENIFASSPSVRVQGSTLKTWDIGSESVKRVQLSIRSDGRPIDADVHLWHTPSYIPTKFRVYTMDGLNRGIDTIIETPKHPKTVAVYNKAEMEFPFDATVANTGLSAPYECLSGITPQLVQGAGQVTSYAFGAEVKSVQVLLKTPSRNMKAKIELTQGPNQVKQVVELYASVGYKNPFYMVIPTPGADNTLRIINQNTVEFPFDAWVLPYETASADDLSPVLGGAWA